MLDKKEESYNNLLDQIIALLEDPELEGSIEEMFRRLLSDYFFNNEIYESKSLEAFVKDLKVPAYLKDLRSLFDIEISELSTFIEGGTINDSLSGSIMLSKVFLKTFYSDHPSSFGQLPDDVKYELVGKIKKRNNIIISAFEKMKIDREADKNRNILTLVALILKNIYRKSGRPFIGKLDKPVEEIIRSIFNGPDDIFKAKQSQMADLGNDSKIKELVKSFFTIRQFKDISEMVELFRDELDRYRKRGMSASISG